MYRFYSLTVLRELFLPLFPLTLYRVPLKSLPEWRIYEAGGRTFQGSECFVREETPSGEMTKRDRGALLTYLLSALECRTTSESLRSVVVGYEGSLPRHDVGGYERIRCKVLRQHRYLS